MHSFENSLNSFRLSVNIRFIQQFLFRKGEQHSAAVGDEKSAVGFSFHSERLFPGFIDLNAVGFLREIHLQLCFSVCVLPDNAHA